jgi:hypothetical protein
MNDEEERMMNDFKPIGVVAQNLLNQLTKDYIERMCNRHIAMLLTDLDELSDDKKEVIKSHFRYFASDIKEQVLGLGDTKDEDKK